MSDGSGGGRVGAGEALRSGGQAQRRGVRREGGVREGGEEAEGGETKWEREREKEGAMDMHAGERGGGCEEEKGERGKKNPRRS